MFCRPARIDQHAQAQVLPAVDQRDEQHAHPAVAQPVHRFRAEQRQNIVEHAVVIGKDVDHDLAHDKRRDHDGHVQDGPHGIAAPEFSVDEHRRRQTQDVLQQAAAEAVDQGVDGGAQQPFVGEQVHEIFQANKAHGLAVAVPGKEGHAHTVDQRNKDKQRDQKQPRYSQEQQLSASRFQQEYSLLSNRFRSTVPHLSRVYTERRAVDTVLRQRTRTPLEGS